MIPELYEGTLAKMPMARFGNDTEVAKAIVFTASPVVPHMKGSNIVIDGEFTQRIQFYEKLPKEGSKLMAEIGFRCRLTYPGKYGQSGRFSGRFTFIKGGSIAIRRALTLSAKP